MARPSNHKAYGRDVSFEMMLGSNEAVTRGLLINGDATHDITGLCEALFGSDPESNRRDIVL